MLGHPDPLWLSLLTIRVSQRCRMRRRGTEAAGVESPTRPLPILTDGVPRAHPVTSAARLFGERRAASGRSRSRVLELRLIPSAVTACGMLRGGGTAGGAPELPKRLPWAERERGRLSLEAYTGAYTGASRGHCYIESRQRQCLTTITPFS